MNQLLTFLGGELCGNIVLALLHTLWQAAVIAAFLYMFLRSKIDADKRYRAGIAALAAIVLCGLFTLAVLNYEPLNRPHTGGISDPAKDHAGEILSSPKENVHVDSVTRPYSEISSRASGPAMWHVWAICLWLTGVMIMLLRTIRIAIGTASLKKQCRPLEDTSILHLVEKLRMGMAITKKIRVVVSDKISVPAVIGFIWPTLLLPVSMASGISVDDLKAILSHELAHIRRYDYLINFCQMILEAVLFFNPAVWFISRQIRIEREACCDSAAIAITRQRTRYAQVLVQWTEKLRAGATDKLSAAPAGFSGTNSGGMLERVKRVAGHRPKTHASWYVTIAMVFVSAAMLFGVAGGMNLTVAFAADILTDQQRIEKIKQIRRQQGFADIKYTEEDKVDISGTIYTRDGQPLPNRMCISVNSQSSNWFYGESTQIQKSEGPTGRGTFKHRIRYGTIWLTVSTRGYALVIAGPFEAEPGGKIADIEIELKKGFKGKIKIIDQKGDPVEAVLLEGHYFYGNGSYARVMTLTTDPNGIAVLENASSYYMKLKTSVDGFGTRTFEKMKLRPDETTVLQLNQIEPICGTVISEITSEPIEDAEVTPLLLINDYGSVEKVDRINRSPDTVTDKNGSFKLGSLRADARYLIRVKAAGHDFKYLKDIRTGRDDLKISLGPKRKIKGKIIGDMQRLKDETGNYKIKYTNYYEYGFNYSIYNSSSSWVDVDVNIKDNTGYFEIDNFFGQQIKIQAASEKIKIDTEAGPIEDVLIDLRPEVVDLPMRKIVLVFDIPEGSAQPQGSFRVDYITERDRKTKDSSYKSNCLDIEDGQMHLEVPVPGRLQYVGCPGCNSQLLGYWTPRSEPINITNANEPLLIKVPVYPAGAIYGQILLDDGNIAQDARVSLLVSKKPSCVKDIHGLINSFSNSNQNMGKFNGTPLPLGGEYVIWAYQNDSYAISKPILLDEKDPIQQMDIKLKEGITLRGRLLDTDGSAAQKPVSLGISFKYSGKGHSRKGKDVIPDKDGYFTFYNVDPDFDGDYFINVATGPGYRPVRKRIDDFDQIVTIDLEEGMTVRGVVIDDETGWPVAGVQVQAYYRERAEDDPGPWYLNADSKTNKKGEFLFSNLDGRKYHLNTTWINLAEPRVPPGVFGGYKGRAILRIEIPEWSDLKPQKPDEE